MKQSILTLGVLSALPICSHAVLIAHYTFDTDATATVGTDATLGASASITGTSKVGAGALSLTGAHSTLGNDGAVSGNLFDWSGGDARTIAFWMQATAGDVGGANATMISLGSGTGTGQRFDVRLNGNDLRLEVQGGGTNTTVAVADGTWHHVAIVLGNDATLATTQYSIDGGTLTAFGGSATAIATGIGELRIGDGYQDSTRDFKGLIDDVRIYNTALTQADVTALAIPEPTSTALLGLGGLALVLRRRK